MKKHKEDIKSNFEGTIIDIETIGSFDDRYNDSRRYGNIEPVIFGFINKHHIQILCARKTQTIEKLKRTVLDILDDLKRPFYAFNCDFEQGVLFHSLDREVQFNRELNKEKFEPKRLAVSTLDIPQYNDPFRDNGFLCMNAWLNGDVDNAMSHNRSCLLKERDILLKRGFREPDDLRFIKEND